MTKLEQFIRGFTNCLYFVDTGDEGDPPSELELSTQALEYIRDVCTEFWNEHQDTIAEASCRSFDITKEDRAGFDFYLTRNGHGAGFWDGDWSEPHATILSDASEGYGDEYVYEDEDGTISIG